MRSLGFDDITLVPRVVSNIESRDDISTKVRAMSVPIVAAPMKDVCDGTVAFRMERLGGMGIIHRFMPINEQIECWKHSRQSDNMHGSACAIGINGDSVERFHALREVGCKIFCIDTANGANAKLAKVIESLGHGMSVDEIGFIVGNVASKECYQWLDSLPHVIAIRVGIAGGAACTTKNATGISYGMVSSIMECASVKKNALLIADGGIQEPRDMCKAIAVGADMVMLGSCIAATSDSPAELVKQDGKFVKVYHGSASFEIQKEYRNNPKYIEGRVRFLEYEGESLEDLVTRFSDGLRSSMSYFNAKNLDEFRAHATWEEK
ncbi:MAG: IMP dehydrogenase [Proteobacteria bacterium]|jgi:IMP dehydrogenase|nr:IMP dehydrogenase [Pseudomonadota bacterium]